MANNRGFTGRNRARTTEPRNVPEKLLVCGRRAARDHAPALWPHDLQREDRLLAHRGRRPGGVRGPLLPSPHAAAEGQRRGQCPVLPLSRAAIRRHRQVHPCAGADHDPARRAGARIPGGPEIRLDLDLDGRSGARRREPDRPLPLEDRRGLGRQGHLFPTSTAITGWSSTTCSTSRISPSCTARRSATRRWPSTPSSRP